MSKLSRKAETNLNIGLIIVSLVFFLVNIPGNYAVFVEGTKKLIITSEITLGGIFPLYFIAPLLPGLVSLLPFIIFSWYYLHSKRREGV